MNTDLEKSPNDSLSVLIGAPSVAKPLVAPGDVAIRAATMADLPFMDGLQKRYGKAIGYFPTKQFEGYIELGGVLVAWASRPCTGETPVPLGYVISRDRYLKRDELGVIYQLCVAPGHQRGLIGASLLKAVFERSAYGCRLYCCWCAQDLAANHFWESMGFVPIAFRAGSGRKKRVHIFWQRRINADDHATNYWYPFQTNSGAIREDRLVFPIPPGTHWSEVKAVELPTRGTGLQPVLPQPGHGLKTRATKEKTTTAAGPGKVAIIVGGRIKYVDRPGAKPAEATETPAVKPARKKAEKPPKRKFDQKYLAAARELRDRYLEHVNDRAALPPAQGKYDVSRTLSSTLSGVEGSAVEGSRSLNVIERPISLLAAG